MMQFGFYVALFIGIALCFLLIPLWIHPQNITQNDTQITLTVAQKKFKQLEIDLSNNVLSQAQFEALKEELLSDLHQDLNQTTPLTFDRTKGRWLALPLGLMLPLLALTMYSLIGDMRVFSENSVPPTANLTPSKTTADINAMVEKLAQRMRDKPDDTQGWVMLGRSYKVLKRYPEAVSAFRQANTLKSADPEILLQLADVVAMANSGSLKGEPTRLIEDALSLEPNNDMGLWLYGLAKAEDNQFDQAIHYWQMLQSHYTPQDQDYKDVQDLIDQAKDAISQTTPNVAIPSKTIKVVVSLDEKFKTRVNDEDVVFIYAQPMHGGMPLAVVKKQVKDLPVNVILDDSMSMISTMTLSSVEQLLISARVSQTGSALPQSGELVGRVSLSTSTQHQTETVNIVINDIVP
jgi:cytochrome c-type biogenesis protein CcmH